MKRFLSIPLLLLALFLTMQPMLALHFCSGKLASVELLQSQEEDNCCRGGASSHEEKHGSLYTIGEKCCHTSVVKLSTDEFEQVVADGNQGHTLKPMFLFTIRSIGSFLLSDTSVATPQRFAPPESVFTTGRKLLTRICILVI